MLKLLKILTFTCLMMLSGQSSAGKLDKISLCIKKMSPFSIKVSLPPLHESLSEAKFVDIDEEEFSLVLEKSKFETIEVANIKFNTEGPSKKVMRIGMIRTHQDFQRMGVASKLFDYTLKKFPHVRELKSELAFDNKKIFFIELMDILNKLYLKDKSDPSIVGEMNQEVRKTLLDELPSFSEGYFISNYSKRYNKLSFFKKRKAVVEAYKRTPAYKIKEKLGLKLKNIDLVPGSGKGGHSQTRIHTTMRR